MPRLTRVWIRTAFVYLAAALGVGVMLAAAPYVGISEFAGAVWPTYLHIFTVGWLTQLIFSVAWWMFPPQSREKPRGDERVGWAAFFLLNGGLLLRVVAEPLQVLRGDGPWRILLVASALVQLAAGLLMAAHFWTRTRKP